MISSKPFLMALIPVFSQLVKVPAPPVGESEDGNKPHVLRRLAPKPGMNNEVFTLTEGDVVLQWPAKMSAASYEDFKDWLDLVARKAKRAVAKPEAEKEQS